MIAHDESCGATHGLSSPPSLVLQDRYQYEERLTRKCCHVSKLYRTTALSPAGFQIKFLGCGKPHRFDVEDILLGLFPAEPGL